MFKATAVEAEEFVLKDSAGRARATLTISEEPIAREVQKYMKGQPTTPTAALVFLDQKGHPTASLEGSKLSFYDESGARLALFHWAGTGSALHFYEANGDASLLMTDAGGPVLSLRDNKGYQATLGAGWLLSVGRGQTQITSAASLVMFNKDGKVIWRAP